MVNFKYKHAARVVKAGGVIAYPTEAVFGLGCDPLNDKAIEKILQLKQRQQDKGLILVAANFSQLEQFLLPLSKSAIKKLEASWQQQSITWLLPAKPSVSKLLCGKYSTLAVRVTNYQPVIKLCELLNSPIVSTSANPASREPAKNYLQVQSYFGNKIDFCLPGRTAGQQKTSIIQDYRTGMILR